jgi:hypothetical protein
MYCFYSEAMKALLPLRLAAAAAAMAALTSSGNRRVYHTAAAL